MLAVTVTDSYNNIIYSFIHVSLLGETQTVALLGGAQTPEVKGLFFSRCDSR